MSKGSGRGRKSACFGDMCCSRLTLGGPALATRARSGSPVNKRNRSHTGGEREEPAKCQCTAGARLGTKTLPFEAPLLPLGYTARERVFDAEDLLLLILQFALADVHDVARIDGVSKGWNESVRGEMGCEALREMPEVKLNECTDEQAAWLGRHTGFRKVNINTSRVLTDVGVGSLALLPNLEALAIRACINITNTAMTSLSVLPHLHTLCLQRCFGVSGEGLSSIAQLPSLERLFLCNCENITNASLAVLQHTAVRELYLCGCW